MIQTMRIHLGRLLTAVLVLVVLGGCGPSPLELYRRGEVARAAQGFAQAVARGDSSPEARYNLGTALLKLGRHDEARPHLEAAADARANAGDRLRQRAHYNAGNTDLEPVFAGKAEGEQKRTRLLRSIERYKRALLLDANDFDAKWNLELAQRLLEDEPPPQGGGGGGGGGENESPDEGDDEEQPQPNGQQQPPQRTSASEGDPDLSQSQADQILSRAEELERDLQRKRLRDPKPPERTARDW